MDLDGDGDTDVAAVKGWFEHEDGRRLRWVYNRKGPFPTGTTGNNSDFPWGYGVNSAVRDVNGDGDVDIVIKPWNSKDNPKDFIYLEHRIIE